jgi:hypothetical protein
LLAIAARLIPGPRTVDDAFITFRYSRNIVEGQGFVYNPGSQVLGTTTPLYTVLLAAISAVVRGEDFQNYAMVVNALADAETAILLFLLARRLTGNRWIGALLGALWAIAPWSVTFAIGGMETSLAIFWMIGAVWLYVTDHRIWMGVFASLGFLTRIDAAIWFGPLLAYQLAERWLSTRGKPILTRLPWQTWLAFVITFLPWLVFSLAYFGSPFPHSLTAKSVAYLIPPGAQFSWLLPRLGTPFLESDVFGGVGAMISTLVYILLSLLGIWYTARHLPRLLPLLIYPWLYVTVFSIANPPVFRWYTVPPFPALMLGIVAGVWALIEWLQKATRTQLVAPVAITLLALFWGGLSLHAWVLHPDHEPDRPAPTMAWHLIELYYQQLGTELREKYGVTPDTVVASADIGAIGYFSRARIVDTVGLVTPEYSSYYPIDPSLVVNEPNEHENYAIPPQLIKDANPDYFVTMEAFVRLGLEKDPQFKAAYGEPIEKIPTGFYGTDMRLYKRQQ